MNSKAAKKSRSKRPPSKKRSRRRTAGAWRLPLLISVIIAIASTVATLVWFPDWIIAPVLLTCAMGAWVLSTVLKLK